MVSPSAEPYGEMVSPSAEPYVALGVMANPSNPRLRDQWREWGQRFVAYQRGVHVRFVFGSSFYEAGLAQGAPTAPQLDLEQAGRGDLIFVDGREKLPNVGVVTEKSAAFWRSASAREPAARWTCKCDDDTLVHLDRLEATLRHVEERNPEQAVYLGHVKWRGWDAGDLGADTYTDGFRFQACATGRLVTGEPARVCHLRLNVIAYVYVPRRAAAFGAPRARRRMTSWRAACSTTPPTRATLHARTPPGPSRTCRAGWCPRTRDRATITQLLLLRIALTRDSCGFYSTCTPTSGVHVEQADLAPCE